MATAGRALHGPAAGRRGAGDYCVVSLLSVLATLAVVSWTGPPRQRPRLPGTDPLLSSTDLVAATPELGTPGEQGLDEPTGHPARHKTYRRHDSSKNYRGIMDSRSTADDGGAALMSKPLCGLLSGEAFGNGTNSGRWYKDVATGHFFWEPHHCRLRRLTGQEARRCLSGRHLHFAGDSLTRYQFLSLAYLIVYGEYPERYGKTGTPSIVAEREWQSWDTFYASMVKVLSSGAGVTAKARCISCNNTRHTERINIEARKFEDTTINDIELTYDYSVFSDKVNLQQAAINNIDWAVRRRVDLIVVNVGLWWPWHCELMADKEYGSAGPHSKDVGTDGHAVARRIIGAGSKAAARRPETHVMWKTTTTEGPSYPREKRPMLEDLHTGALAAVSSDSAWTVMDVRAITDAARAQKLYLNIPGDPLHFLPVGYEMMNDLLLNTICDAPDAHWALYPHAAV